MNRCQLNTVAKMAHKVEALIEKGEGVLDRERGALDSKSYEGMDTSDNAAACVAMERANSLLRQALDALRHVESEC